MNKEHILYIKQYSQRDFKTHGEIKYSSFTVPEKCSKSKKLTNTIYFILKRLKLELGKIVGAQARNRRVKNAVCLPAVHKGGSPIANEVGA